MSPDTRLQMHANANECCKNAKRLHYIIFLRWQMTCQCWIFSIAPSALKNQLLQIERHFFHHFVKKQCTVYCKLKKVHSWLAAENPHLNAALILITIALFFLIIPISIFVIVLISIITIIIFHCLNCHNSSSWTEHEKPKCKHSHLHAKNNNHVALHKRKQTVQPPDHISIVPLNNCYQRWRG